MWGFVHDRRYRACWISEYEINADCIFTHANEHDCEVLLMTEVYFWRKLLETWLWKYSPDTKMWMEYGQTDGAETICRSLGA